MRVSNVASPHAVQQVNSNPAAQKARAVEAFKRGAPLSEAPAQQTSQQQAGLNPNNISPEEIGAVKQTKSEPPENINELATSEDTTPESTPVETKSEQKIEKDPALSRQFAQLARQERQLRAKVQAEMKAIETQKAELAAQQAAIKAKESEYSQGYISRDQLKSETLRILAESGVDTQGLYNQMTEYQLNPTDPRVDSTIKQLQSQIKGLEAKLEEGKQQQADSQQQAYKAAVKQIETDVRNLVTMDPQFEAIKATRSIPDVVELIEETYKKDGYLMSVEEACDEVEKYLVDEAMKITRIGKIKRQLEQAGQPKSNEMKTQANPKQTQPTMKTLTNAAASTRKLTAKERAVLAFKGELKN